jgi:hypothetical protein
MCHKAFFINGLCFTKFIYDYRLYKMVIPELMQVTFLSLQQEYIYRFLFGKWYMCANPIAKF